MGELKNSLLFFLIIFCLGLQAKAQDTQQARLTDLPQESVTQWIKLYHYKKTLFGYEGRVRNNSFYFNQKEGSSNPHSEFETALTILNQTAPSQHTLAEKDNPFCRFPARVIWFRKNFPSLTKSWPQAQCPQFDGYLKGLSGESISVVFSSYFLNNPSSAFGHSFLRINKAAGTDGQRYELLDYGVNFAATVDTGNPIFYAFRGISGGFLGSFTNVPYYFKVREYNNSESRDLWEYELNVDRHFVHFFIAHLWEVGPTDIRYYYLSENCSFWVLAVIDAIDPQYHIIERLKRFVIPSDTIRTVWETPGLVKTFKYRPSIHSELNARLKDMSDDEKSLMMQIHRTRKIELEHLLPEQKRKILDASLDYYEYKYPTEIQKKDTPEAKFKDQLLSARSQVNLVSPPLNIAPRGLDRPHLSHSSKRISIGGISSNQNGNYLHFQYRFALHDQLDPIQGYPEYAEIVFGDFDFTYSQNSGKAELNKFTLFEVLSNTEFTKIEPHISWRVRVGVDRVRVSDFPYCHGPAFELGGGITSNLGLSDALLLYAGVKGTSQFLPSCEGQFILGAGPNLRARYKFTPHWISLAEAYWRQDNLPTKNYREVSFGTQWSANEKWGIRAQLFEKNFEQSAQLDWIGYF